jgi:WhiB family redox-sensing transcriptional regulator|tara:strand:+ start:795 stop:1052 length:258 start_codon:yes stop_codon:yes gene_type:complete
LQIDFDLTKASCREKDNAIFFTKKTGQAKQICSTCEVKEECRDYAVRNYIPFGVWGGLSAYELNKYRKQKYGGDTIAPRNSWTLR